MTKGAAPPPRRGRRRQSTRERFEPGAGRCAGEPDLGTIELVATVRALAGAPDRIEELERRVAAALGLDTCRLVAQRGRSWVSVHANAVAAGEAAGALGSGGGEIVELGGPERLGLHLEPAPLSARRSALAAALGREIEEVRATARTSNGARELELQMHAAFDRLALGILFVDRDGAVVHANRSAHDRLAAVASPLASGRPLRLRETGDAERFAALLARHRSSSSAAAPGARPAETLRVPRAGHQPPLEILALARDGHFSAETGGLVLFVFDPESAGATPAAALGAHYGLTPCEAKLAAEILRGGDLEEIAGRLAISRETARTHLRHLFAKVGTTRQADLVRLLLAGPAGLHWD